METFFVSFKLSFSFMLKYFNYNNKTICKFGFHKLQLVSFFDDKYRLLTRVYGNALEDSLILFTLSALYSLLYLGEASIFLGDSGGIPHIFFISEL